MLSLVAITLTLLGLAVVAAGHFMAGGVLLLVGAWMSGFETARQETDLVRHELDEVNRKADYYWGLYRQEVGSEYLNDQYFFGNHDLPSPDALCGSTRNEWVKP